MKVAVTSEGQNLDAPMSSVFGRCRYFVVVDSESMECEAVANAAVSASGGAGIQSAQWVSQHGADAVISGNVGPNAVQVLVGAGIPIYAAHGGTVREAVEALSAGRLQPLGGPTVPADYAKPAGLGRGMGGGRRMGGGRGMGVR